ncbi:hypothetical protein ACFQ0B_71955 [Nonomuraea thailandensis]
MLAPSWKDDSRLYLISDASGWWNLYEVGMRGEGARALAVAEEEFTLPPWQLGGMPYTVLPDGRLAVLHGRGDLRLGLLDPGAGTLTDLDLPYSGWNAALAADGTSVIGIAYAAATPARSWPSTLSRAGTSRSGRPSAPCPTRPSCPCPSPCCSGAPRPTCTRSCTRPTPPPSTARPRT